MKTRVRIIWNNRGGELELDSVLVNNDGYTAAITKAFIRMLQGKIVLPGDFFSVKAVD